MTMKNLSSPLSKQVSRNYHSNSPCGSLRLVAGLDIPTISTRLSPTHNLYQEIQPNLSKFNQFVFAECLHLYRQIVRNCPKMSGLSRSVFF